MLSLRFLGMVVLGMLLLGAFPARAQQSPPASPVAAVTIESRPPGALVSVEEHDQPRPLGHTPLQVALDARRSHVVTIALQGYASQRARIDPGEMSLAVELQPATPLSYLRHHAGGHPWIVATMPALLLACAAGLVFRHRRSRALRQVAPSPGHESAPPLAPPSLPAEYEILGRLGEGNEADVYRARHRSLGEMVALKVLKRDALDEEGLQRFHREMEIGRDLHHPHLAHVYAFGNVNGVPWLATELVEGDTLQERLARGPMPPEELIPVAMQVCEGLAACHDQGIIHRDLKPANIMLTRDGGVRLLDFGIARRADRRCLTATGAPLGTPMYVAPEQVRGHAEMRSDIYSLGVILFEALTGRPPFDAEDAVGLMMAHCADVPPTVSDLAPHISPGLSALVNCMLAKDPDQRPRDARAVQDCLVSLVKQPAHAVRMGGAGSD